MQHRKGPRGFLFTFIAVAGLAGFSPMHAEEAPLLGPGQGGMDGKTLKPFRATTSWGTLAVERGKVDDHDVLYVVNSVNSGSGPITDTIVLDGKSLALLHRFSPYFAVGKDYLAATVRGKALSGSLNALGGGPPVVIDTQLEMPVFEEAALGLVLAAMPLREGFRAQLPRLGVRASNKEFFAGRLEVHVTGRESTKAGDGETYSCWVVDANWVGADYKEVLWIANQPPYLIKKEAIFGEGKSRSSGFKKVEVGR